MSSLCVWSIDGQLLESFGITVSTSVSGVCWSFVGGGSLLFVILFGLFGGIFVVLFDLDRNKRIKKLLPSQTKAACAG